MMVRIICTTGFLGSGKTTLLNKILPVCLNDSKVAVVENDFGDTGIDAGLVARTGTRVRELAAGCICCSLRGELKAALQELIGTENPGLIFIEPSGISRSSDILSALQSLEENGSVSIGNVVNLVDAANFEDYLETFGDFYGDQITSARTILLSHQQSLPPGRLTELIAKIRALNPEAAFLNSDWLELDGETLWTFLTKSPITDGHCPRNTSGPGPGRIGVETFSSWSGFPALAFSREDLDAALEALAAGQAGLVLRAKGFCRAADGSGWHFDYLKGHRDIKPATAPGPAGRVLVIGQNLTTDLLAELFRIENPQ